MQRSRSVRVLLYIPPAKPELGTPPRRRIACAFV